MSIPSDKIDELLFADYVFRREVFSSYLLFLAGESDRNLTGRFLLHVEKHLTEGFSETLSRLEKLQRRLKNTASQRQTTLDERHPSTFTYPR